MAQGLRRLREPREPDPNRPAGSTGPAGAAHPNPSGPDTSRRQSAAASQPAGAHPSAGNPPPNAPDPNGTVHEARVPPASRAWDGSDPAGAVRIRLVPVVPSSSPSSSSSPAVRRLAWDRDGAVRIRRVRRRIAGGRVGPGGLDAAADCRGRCRPEGLGCGGPGGPVEPAGRFGFGVHGVPVGVEAPCAITLISPSGGG